MGNEDRIHITFETGVTMPWDHANITFVISEQKPTQLDTPRPFK